VTEGIAPFMFAYNVSESRQIARMQLLEDELLEISCSKVNCSNMTLLELQFLEKNVLLESNYHTQDNAVIVITKATSVLHLIN
jgi:hypothetical protein